MPDNHISPQFYGIWIPGQGWWKLPDAKQGGIAVAYAETRRDVAEHWARWVGHGAFVLPVDISLTNGEKDLLALEAEHWERRFIEWSKSTWRTLTTWLSKRK